MKYVLGLLLGSILCHWASAQTISDTVNLVAVTVYGINNSHYTSGSKSEKIDSGSIKSYGTSSLSDVLGSTTPIFIRSYGNSTLASVSFRGTGANHTSILWNGLNINQPTLGQSDLSLFPAFAIDQAEVHFGGGSPLFGSDAIGGTISLSDKKSRNLKQEGLEYLIETGSYGRQFYGSKFLLGNKRIQSKTVLYLSSLDNDFEFSNLTKQGFPQETQKNAALSYHGIIQNLYFNLNPNWLASFKTWYYESERGNQPNMPLNDNSSMYASQQDASLRLLTDFVYGGRKNETTQIKAAYLYDKLIYQLGSAIEEYYTYQYQLIADHERLWHRNFKSRVGVKTNRIAVDSDGFNFSPTEIRSDFYLSNTYQPNNNFRTSLNLRQVLMNRTWAPPSPSIGLDWTFLELPQSSFSINAQASRSYRLPTFNERYWPTGNPDILPEQGYSNEVGISYSLNQLAYLLNLEARAYNMLIDDWVVWQDGNGGTTPVNIKKVQSQGIEWSAKLSGQISSLKYSVLGNYSYSKSITKESRLSDDYIGKQLIYTPLQKANISTVLNYKNLSGNLNWIYTGYRYYSLSNEDDFLPSYQLVDLSLFKKIDLGDFNLEAGIKVYNLFDTQYQALRFYAMPGRNFRISINFNI